MLDLSPDHTDQLTAFAPKDRFFRDVNVGIATLKWDELRSLKNEKSSGDNDNEKTYIGSVGFHF
jgi:hypothetical protein